MATIVNSESRPRNGVGSEDITNYRILIIDDNPNIHRDFRKILCPQEPEEDDRLEAFLFDSKPVSRSRTQFLLDSAYQGQEGLELVRRAMEEEKPYAMVFLDMRMPPGWDGIETALHLWEADPQLQIIICTAYSDYSWSDMAEKLGQTDQWVILKKPFDTVEALQLLHALTAKWSLSRQSRERLAELDGLIERRTAELSRANEKLQADIIVRKKAELVLSAFATLGNRLSAAPDAKAAGQIIVDVADQLLGWDSCICALYSAAQDHMSYLLSYDIIGDRRTECTAQMGDLHPTGLGRKTIQEGGQLVLRQDYSTMRADGTPFGDASRPSASILYVPIRHDSTVVGVLSIQSYTPQAYDPRSLETLQALADHCGGALNRIKAEETLHRTEAQFRQAQKLEAVGQLAGGVAHDFNNLLAVIMVNASLAMDEADPRSIRECLTQITAAANQSATLTRQLLAFGRKQVVCAESLDLNKLVTDLSKMLTRIVGEHIQLHTAHDKTLPGVQADVGMMSQVIMNLVVNARDAMPESGQIHIATEAMRFDASDLRVPSERRPGHFACLTVRDTGTGIAPELMTRIFEPFFTTKAVGKGTGLGLATVFGIVKQHQGWVEVTSKVGIGTTFQIFLPALDSCKSAA